MGGRKMEGDEQQRRQAAREAREHGELPSERGATLGASKQHKDSDRGDHRQDRLRQKNEGKQDPVTDGRNEPRPSPHGS